MNCSCCTATVLLLYINMKNMKKEGTYQQWQYVNMYIPKIKVALILTNATQSDSKTGINTLEDQINIPLHHMKITFKMCTSSKKWTLFKNHYQMWKIDRVVVWRDKSTSPVSCRILCCRLKAISVLGCPGLIELSHPWESSHYPVSGPTPPTQTLRRNVLVARQPQEWMVSMRLQ